VPATEPGPEATQPRPAGPTDPTDPGRGGPADATSPALLRAAADVLAGLEFAGWFYGDSIGFEGLLAASEVLGDPRYRAFAHGFLRGWATRAEPYREMDNTAPGRALCLLAESEPDAVLLDAGRRLAGHLMARPTIGPGMYPSFARAPLREPYGGSALPPDEQRLLADPGPGVYVDCLHFDPPFLAHLGRLTGERAMLQAAIDQALGYVRLLQDPATGLVHHFWLERTGRPYILGWARGQGWALLGLLDTLEQLAADEPGRAELEGAVRALGLAMVERQRPDGHWHAVAGDAASGHESSTAAFMATGLAAAVERGLLDEGARGAARAAWHATLGSLGADGVLRDVSAAVWSCTQLEHYRRVPTGFTVPWGQGPVLLAAARWAVSTSTRARGVSERHAGTGDAVDR
jgi:unsaturated rhamnogalacturonyl hydrolase